MSQAIILLLFPFSKQQTTWGSVHTTRTYAHKKQKEKKKKKMGEEKDNIISASLFLFFFI